VEQGSGLLPPDAAGYSELVCNTSINGIPQTDGASRTVLSKADECLALHAIESYSVPWTIVVQVALSPIPKLTPEDSIECFG
jgi:hypothetical protein